MNQRPVGGARGRLANGTDVAECQVLGLNEGRRLGLRRGMQCAMWTTIALCFASAAPAADFARLDAPLAAWVSGGGAPRGTALEDVQMTISPTGQVQAKVMVTVRENPGLTLGGVPVSFATESVASPLCDSRRA